MHLVEVPAELTRPRVGPERRHSLEVDSPNRALDGLLLSMSLFACGTQVVDAETGVTSSGLTAASPPDCKKEEALYNDAYAAPWDCGTRQQQDPRVNCGAEAFAMWNVAYCKAGWKKRALCACEIPEVRDDDGRQFRCNGSDGGCLNPRWRKRRALATSPLTSFGAQSPYPPLRASIDAPRLTTALPERAAPPPRSRVHGPLE
jgi:hypothetical protein